MLRSTDRIITTHVGSLARPHDLLDIMKEREHGRPYDADAFAQKFDIKLSKDQKEGMFFVFPNSLVISIVPETSWYTVRVS